MHDGVVIVAIAHIVEKVAHRLWGLVVQQLHAEVAQGAFHAHVLLRLRREAVQPRQHDYACQQSFHVYLMSK